MSTEAWQPIETAPRDGRLIWAFERGRGVERRQYIAWWVDCGPSRDEGQYWQDDNDSEPSPTHWMPLPTPPLPEPPK